MSFREKTAWVMMTLLIAAGGFYAWEVIGHALAIGSAPPPSGKLAMVYLLIVIAGTIIGMSSLAGREPDEASAPVDEREQIAIDKAGNWSGYVLAVPAIAGVLHYWTHSDGDLLFHTIVGALMLCQIAEYGSQIWLYRRGV
ncbi:MAG: hypothetical protein Hens3KO_16670 [Henriciella sp.]